MSKGVNYKEGESVKISITKKHLIYIVGTIILGALGSGLWDLAIKPFLKFSTEFVVNILLEAFGGVQSSIYKDIASLDREITGQVLVSFFMGSLMGVVTVLVSRTFRKVDKDGETISSRPSKFYMALLGLYILVFTTSTVGRTSYVLGKQNDYLQLKRIVSPYLSEDEIIKIDSEFSLIDSIEEYLKLMEKMKAVTAEQNIQLPSHIK